MEQYKCIIHSVIIEIPYTEKEFQNGKFHQGIEDCNEHLKQFPNCKFEKVGGSS